MEKLILDFLGSESVSVITLSLAASGILSMAYYLITEVTKMSFFGKINRKIAVICARLSLLAGMISFIILLILTYPIIGAMNEDISFLSSLTKVIIFYIYYGIGAMPVVIISFIITRIFHLEIKD